MRNGEYSVLRCVCRGVLVGWEIRTEEQWHEVFISFAIRQVSAEHRYSVYRIPPESFGGNQNRVGRNFNSEFSGIFLGLWSRMRSAARALGTAPVLSCPC